MTDAVPFPVPVQRSAAAMTVLLIPLLCAVLLTKFAIPPFGEQGIGISIPVILLGVAIGILAGRVRVDPARFALFLILTGGLGLMPLFHGEFFSLNSIALFVAVHLPLVFAVAAGHDGADRATAVFLDLCLFLAWLGIAQFFLQFVMPASFLFPIENFVPDAFVVDYFNMQAPLGYGTDLYRANGVFQLEPSYFAQLLAIAVIAELTTHNRLRRIPVYALALLLAHSGTGLMILAICLPLFVVSRRRWDLLLSGIAFAAVLFFLREHFFLDRLLSRVDEFGATESSGFARFVGGFYLFDEFLWNDPWRTLFGAGAGAFQPFAQRSAYVAAEMPLFKTLFEFGVLGTLAYFGFILYCLFASSAPRLISLAILICLLLNGLYVPFAHAIALTLLIWPGHDATEAVPVSGHGQTLPVGVPRYGWASHPAGGHPAGGLS